MGQKALVLSSGGIDSTTCIALAIDTYGKENVESVSFKYGQRHLKELQSAEAVADYYGIKHHIIDFTSSGIFDGSNCSLLENSETKIKHKSYEEQIKEDGIVNTYVPFRNGLMVSAAASLAFVINPDGFTAIFVGTHADDAAGNAYADCSLEFMENLDKAIQLGTYGKVNIIAPLIRKNKSEVVKEGLRLNAPYNLTWSCYEGGEVACGKCATCVDRLKAFKDNNMEDPINYED